MDKKITQLTQVTELTGAELLPLAQGGVTKSASVDQLRGYKVYTALLTQSGGDDPQDIFSGNLTVGVTYQIFDDGGASGYDFTNVGAPNNDLFTFFVATGTTPNSWGTNTGLSYNTGAPVVTVLENTIGNIWWTYDSSGVYNLNSSNLVFTNQNTFAQSVVVNDGGTPIPFNFAPNFPFDGKLFVYGQDSYLNNTPIEIRVYN